MEVSGARTAGMADESNAYLKYGRQFLKGLVVFLIAISLAASYALVAEQGLTLAVLGDIFVTLYIAGLVFYGVFWDAMDTRRFRLALYAGVILWGAERLLSGQETLLTYALLLGGMGLLVRELYFKQ